MSFLTLKALRKPVTLVSLTPAEQESRSIQSFQEIIRLLPFYREERLKPGA